MPAVQDRTCPVQVPAGTRCGFLLVPERRGVPGSRTIKVGFAVHRSAAPDRKPDPVVYTSGGPGSGSIQLTGYLSQMTLGRDRDVVVLEQRGSRWSEPALDCPEIARGVLDALARPGPMRSETAGIARGAGTCRDRLAKEGVDLRGYTTAEIAADVVDLRRALGYDKWNLFGVSYSTRSMLAAAAADPGGVRSVVLDSFLPAQVDWYGDAPGNLDATLRSFGPQWRDLPERFARMVARYDAQPATVVTTDPLTGGRLTVRLTGEDLMTIFAEALHEVDFIPVAPTMIGALADGRQELLGALADAAGPSLVSRAMGLYYAVQCQDEVDPAAAGQLARLFTTVVDRAVCQAWRLPYSAGTAAITQAPVLVVGGALDPTTPPRTARSAAGQLPRGRFVEFAGVGHAVFLSSLCGRTAISAFVADPASSAVLCDPGRAPNQVIGPGELRPTAMPYRMLVGGEWWWLALLAVFAAVSLGQVTAAVVIAVRRWRAARRGAEAPRLWRVLPLLLAGAAGLTFLALMAYGLYEVAAVNETVLAAGVPASMAGYVVPLVVALVLSGWRRRGERLWPRLLAAVVAFGTLLWWFQGFA
ncbi:alpha/beta fold hydrolase [Streptosporangium sp. NPDC000396]|uniref:alpha/beta fold hydrolase n=1 Tax=Streptosporangium sp. NPDC000396 TaxID=3366185 RepID=UPI0036C196E8